MLLRKEGFPEDGELVLSTVTNIHFHSVFVNMDEYNKTGLVHISEISPGRIRNLRDFVVEGKKIVCKVLKIDTVKGHIDLSLRRVNESQRRMKINEIKQEQLAEKIVEFVAKKLSKPITIFYKELKEKIFKKYDGLYPCFVDVSKGDISLKDFDVDAAVVKELEESIKQRIKESVAEIRGTLVLKTVASDGIDVIKKALTLAEGKSKGISIRYKSAGNYQIIVQAPNFKEGEKILGSASESAIKYVIDHHGEGSFVRQEA